MRGNWVRSTLAVVIAASLVVVAGPHMLEPEPLSGSDWNIYVADTGIDDVGEHASLALDSNDNPHMSYWDRVNNELKYAKRTGGTWKNEIVDKGGMYTSLALDSNNHPQISYYDVANKDLK
ncbi:MAG: hypothetical protein KAW09_03605, partial [Thermoplasmata archaeon]|nr:hypothetical protein [Thermoplasmata archaeon]